MPTNNVDEIEYSCYYSMDSYKCVGNSAQFSAINQSHNEESSVDNSNKRSIDFSNDEFDYVSNKKSKR